MTAGALVRFGGIIRWVGGIVLTGLGFVFAEGWIIVTVNMLGFILSTVVLTVIMLLISWLVIYLAGGSCGIARFREWLRRKEEQLTGRAQAALKGGKALAIANTAAFLGPIFSAILMIALGIERRRIYAWTVPCAFLWAVIWCGLYSGLFWGIRTALCGRA